MTISLKKGQKINLSKEKNGLSKIMVGLGWDAEPQGQGCLFALFSSQNIDCDASAFLLKDGKLLNENQDIVYFGRKKHKSGAVCHSGDNLTGAGKGDDEVINVDLKTVPSDYNGIVFTVNIFSAHERKQHFGMIKNAYIRIVDLSSKVEICKYNLSENYDKMTAMIAGELTKEGNEWHFNAIGEATQDNSIGDLKRRFM